MKFSRIISAVSALVLTAGVSVIPGSFTSADSAAAADNSVIYEFEDGKTEGGKIYSDGASGVDMRLA